MKIKLTFLLIVFAVSVNAQITFDQSIPGDIYKTVLTGDGQKLYYYNSTTRQIVLQNMDKSIYKTILVPETSDNSPSISYVSDSLFNTDNKIEYLLEYYNQNDSILILNEDGVVLLHSPGYTYFDPEHDFILDTKTKLIVRVGDGDSSLVYVLPGKYEPTLTASSTPQTLMFNKGVLSISGGNSVDISSVNTDEQQISLKNDTLYLTNGGSVYIGQEISGSKVVSLDINGASNAYPNPASNSIQVNYQLPSNENGGTLELINHQGVVQESIFVYENNGIINLDLSNYLSGQYFIKLYTKNGFSSVNKALIIK